jgi:hypothetical protein
LIARNDISMAIGVGAIGRIHIRIVARPEEVADLVCEAVSRPTCDTKNLGPKISAGPSSRPVSLSHALVAARQ